MQLWLIEAIIRQKKVVNKFGFKRIYPRLRRDSIRIRKAKNVKSLKGTVWVRP